MLRASKLIPGVRFDKLSALLRSAQCGLSLSKPARRGGFQTRPYGSSRVSRWLVWMGPSKVCS